MERNMDLPIIASTSTRTHYNFPAKSKATPVYIDILRFGKFEIRMNAADSDEIEPKKYKWKRSTLIVFLPSEVVTSNSESSNVIHDIVIQKLDHENCPILFEGDHVLTISPCQSISEQEFQWHEDFKIEDTMIHLPGLLYSSLNPDIFKDSPLALSLTDAICKHAKENSLRDIIAVFRNCISSLDSGYVNEMITSLSHIMSNKKVPVKKSSNKILIQRSSVLGEGGFGKVYRGTFENREVAVKVVEGRHCRFAENEIAALCILERHPNVIIYYGIDKVEDSYHIALELCSINLNDWLQNPDKNSKISRLEILKHISKGMNHIHERGIIHRDLKPDNILVQEKGNEIRILISDFGLGRKLPEGKHSITNSKSQIGSYAWMAPEVWTKERLTNAVDIFSLGCLFYFVLTEGDHPFGDLEDPILIPASIRLGNFKKPLSISNDIFGIANLIEEMIQMDSSRRPSVEFVLKHPMFWDNGKKMKLFTDVKLTIRNKAYETFFINIEKGREIVFSGNWIDYLEDPVQAEVRRKGKYDVTKFMDLLRLIRNKDEHYDELQDDVKSIMGSKTDYVCYWLRKFPQLLPYTWEKFRDVRNDTGFIHSIFY